MYTEKQLADFAAVPSQRQDDKAKRTHEAVREAISLYYDKQAIEKKYGLYPNFDIFLQGSYKNDTDIQKTSDVDIVVCLENLFEANNTLASSKKINYPFTQFNNDIKIALAKYFKYTTVTNANKCLKIPAHSTPSTTYGNADVIPALAYRNIVAGSINADGSSYEYYEGIAFYTNNNRQVINYPKFHYENLIQKSKRTNGNFKATVRMFKNIKEDLINKGKISSDIVKSYFIENMLYNVDDIFFSISNLQQRFKEILQFIITTFNTQVIKNWKNANGFDYLVKPIQTQNSLFSIEKGIWDRNDVLKFLQALYNVANGN